jgi:hypothetical protein
MQTAAGRSVDGDLRGHVIEIWQTRTHTDPVFCAVAGLTAALTDARSLSGVLICPYLHRHLAVTGCGGGLPPAPGA